MSFNKPISSISQKSQESETRDPDDSFSSTGSVGGRRPRASTSTIPLSVAYGALPNASATGEHAGAARPVSPQQPKRGTTSPSPAPQLVLPVSPTPTPTEAARQRYAALKDQKQAALAQKQQQQLKQRQSLTAPGFISAPPVPSAASMRDTTVGAATAIHSAGGVRALNAMYANGVRGGHQATDRRPRSKLAEPPQTVKPPEDEDEEMDDEIEEEEDATTRGHKRPRSPVMDMIMSGAAKVKYVVKEREPEAMDEDEDEREQSYDYAEEDRYVEEGSLMDVDEDPKKQTKPKTKRKRDEEKSFKPGEVPEDDDEEIDDDAEPDELDDGATKKTRKRPKTTADKKAYRPSSEEPYATDEDLGDTPRRRRSKVKVPTRLPFPANADMSHKNRRKSTTKKGRKSTGGDEDDSMDADETMIVDKQQASQKSKSIQPGIAQITPQPSTAAAVAPQKPARSSSTLVAPAPAERARSRSTLAPPVTAQGRGTSPATAIAGARAVSPSYVGPGHPAYAPFALRPDIQHTDSNASAAAVDKQLAEEATTPEHGDEADGDEEMRPPPWQSLMHGLVNIFYYTLIWPLTLISRLLSPGFAYGRDLLAKLSWVWGPIVFWGVGLLVLYIAVRGFTTWAGDLSGLDAIPYPPLSADSPPEMGDVLARVAQLEERLRRAMSELAARETAPAQESRLVGDVDQLWKRVYRMEDEMRQRKSTEINYGSTLDKLSSDLPALRSRLEAINGGGQALDDRFKHIDVALAETRKGSEYLLKELEQTKSLVKHADGFIEQTQTELRMISKTAEQALAEAKRAEKAAKSATVNGSGGSVNSNLVDARLAQLGYNTILRTDHALFEYGSGIAPQFTSPQYDVFAPTTNKPRLSGLFGKPAPLGPDASAVIMPFLDPGHCWAFKGDAGSIGIRLHRFIYVDEIVLEIPPQPMLDQPDTTPKQFDVWGYVEGGNSAKQQEYLKTHPSANTPTPPHNDPKFLHLGSFEYDDQGNAIQSFILDASPSEHNIDFGLLVFTFSSNYGGEYTCLYRIRVHGEPSGNNLYDLRS
ncbi:hypothetical protein CALVIDRAFT_533524 [Calocera viscosa TUFC12733]|uniref:SUN domain-containing protein n=1 Tax=Calocera viscosa (strain TUFC12733) TaxID=1330018 RepID=A0A167R3F4_CALVF|nr:hypothetical protein CALVIDRAFT_533524 [Calocera viscosa TUFC12733]